MSWNNKEETVRLYLKNVTYVVPTLLPRNTFVYNNYYCDCCCCWIV